MKNIIKYIKFSVALALFFFGSLLRYIPIFIFKLDPQNLSIENTVVLTLFSNSICFIILFSMYRKSIIQGLKELKPKKFTQLSEGFNIWFIGLMIMVFSNTIITYFNQGGTSTNEESIRLMLKSLPFLSTISIAFLAPCIEELVFRKSFREIFHNKWIYIATSGILFGALHVFLSPIYSWLDYLYLIPYCSVGIAFAYMYYKTNNIMVSISMHVLHNTINTISTLLMAGVIW